MWKPDRESKKPLYVQIADHLEQRISYGADEPSSLYLIALMLINHDLLLDFRILITWHMTP